MKKITLMIALAFSSCLMFGQVYFEDNFDGSGPGIAPGGWTVVDVDGRTPATAMSEFTSAWITVNRDGSAIGGGNYGGPAGNYAAASTSWYSPAGASDDWLITPAISPTTNSSVTWDAKAQDAAYPDGYELRISTTGTSVPADFSTVLYSTSGETSAWSTRNVDLTAYTGQTIYLAWRNNSTDKFVLLVDNVIVEEIPACSAPSNFVTGPNGISHNSVDIAWTNVNGAGTTFDIEYGAEGFALGSGTVVNNLTTPNYEFTGLTAESVYEFYITANCSGGNGSSSQLGPISFATGFDCSSYGLPYIEDWSSATAFNTCYTIEDTNSDDLTWTFNTANDLDGDGVNDDFVNIFPQGPGVAKNDWLFTPAINGTANAVYSVTVIYNGVDVNAAANESFNLVITDTPSSTATTQSTIGSYNGITQSGLYGDTTGNDLVTQAYSSTATYTASADGDFHVAIHANTIAANSDVFMILGIQVSETLSVNDFELNAFSHNYNKTIKTLNIESSNMAMTGVEIYSLLGQKVITRSLNNTSESIDVSSLVDGVYLAKVNIGGNSKTIKFIKN